jgi:hypothetical protein
MAQQGQVFGLGGRGTDGRTVWAYRYRVGGRGSRRVQRGGFESERAAAQALARAVSQCSMRLRVIFPKVRTLQNVGSRRGREGGPGTAARRRGCGGFLDRELLVVRSNDGGKIGAHVDLRVDEASAPPTFNIDTGPASGKPNPMLIDKIRLAPPAVVGR